jgi:hypothetical protein
MSLCETGARGGSPRLAALPPPHALCMMDDIKGQQRLPFRPSGRWPDGIFWNAGISLAKRCPAAPD